MKYLKNQIMIHNHGDKYEKLCIIYIFLFCFLKLLLHLSLNKIKKYMCVNNVYTILKYKLKS